MCLKSVFIGHKILTDDLINAKTNTNQIRNRLNKMGEKSIFLALFAVRWLQNLVFLLLWPSQAFYYINVSNNFYHRMLLKTNYVSRCDFQKNDDRILLNVNIL